MQFMWCSCLVGDWSRLSTFSLNSAHRSSSSGMTTAAPTSTHSLLSQIVGIAQLHHWQDLVCCHDDTIVLWNKWVGVGRPPVLVYQCSRYLPQRTSVVERYLGKGREIERSKQLGLSIVVATSNKHKQFNPQPFTKEACYAREYIHVPMIVTFSHPIEYSMNLNIFQPDLLSTSIVTQSSSMYNSIPAFTFTNQTIFSSRLP